MQKEEPHKPLLIPNTQTIEREKAKNSLKFSSSIDLHGVFTSYSVMIEASNTCSLTHSLTLALSTSDELLLTGLTFRKHLKLVKFTLPKQKMSFRHLYHKIFHPFGFEQL